MKMKDLLPKGQVLKEGKHPLPKITFDNDYVVNKDWKDGDSDESYYKTETFEAEVLTVNFNANTMRVRWKENGSPKTRDMPADAFFEKFKISNK